VVERRSILVRLPPATKQGVDEHSERLGLSRNQFIVDAVELYLEHVAKDRTPVRDVWWK